MLTLTVRQIVVLDSDDQNLAIPKGPATVMVITVILFFVTALLLQQVATVVTTLAAVEDPDEGYRPLSNESNQHLLLEDDEVEGHPQLAADGNARNRVYGGKNVFVTSSIRRTLAYLRQEAGPWAPFRGLSVNIVQAIVQAIANFLVGGLLSPIIPRIFHPLLGFLVCLCLAPFSLISTHIVITVPSQRTWFTVIRTTPLRLSKLSLPAVAAEFIAMQVAVIPSTLVYTLFLMRSMTSTGSIFFNLCVLLFSIALYVTLFLFVTLPATVVRRRVQASLLPEGEEPIIPFDSKTWGTIVTMRDAIHSVASTWKSFNSSDRLRLFKMYVKFTMTYFALFLVFWVLFAGEMLWMVKENPEIGRRLKDAFINGQP
ncbi:hypothetical protein V1517DRAFT_324264 [Lipomyces orientalis]|uniref:Uncharacterized protein n=1 Tax=Lipomyces orientalis TaxID=1233043 RepID=A0ACC3TMQ5_9ASCO